MTSVLDFWWDTDHKLQGPRCDLKVQGLNCERSDFFPPEKFLETMPKNGFSWELLAFILPIWCWKEVCSHSHWLYTWSQRDHFKMNLIYRTLLSDNTKFFQFRQKPSCHLSKVTLGVPGYEIVLSWSSASSGKHQIIWFQPNQTAVCPFAEISSHVFEKEGALATAGPMDARHKQRV